MLPRAAVLRTMHEIRYAEEAAVALLDCKFYSESLGLSTAMTVILPQQSEGQIGMQSVAPAVLPKTLFLLHGLSDDHTIWVRRTSIERYTAPLGIAVVMPAAYRSFYTDMQRGGAYETFIAEELPRIARSFFRVSDRPEDTFIAGLSMGGYGAFKIALNNPERYAAAASLSGSLDIVKRVAEDGPPRHVLLPDFINIFGPDPALAGTRHDLFSLLEARAKERKPLPRLYACCGELDTNYGYNVAFRELAARMGVDLRWQSDPGFGHTWDYWDLRIQSVLEWMVAERQ